MTQCRFVARMWVEPACQPTRIGGIEMSGEGGSVAALGRRPESGRERRHGRQSERQADCEEARAQSGWRRRKRWQSRVSSAGRRRIGLRLDYSESLFRKFSILIAQRPRLPKYKRPRLGGPQSIGTTGPAPSFDDRAHTLWNRIRYCHTRKSDEYRLVVTGKVVGAELRTWRV